MPKGETKHKDLEDSRKLDHRALGQEMDLFSFHDVAPGAPFWHPKGMTIYKELEKFIREENEDMGYGEVSTPILVKKELWEKSGHWDNFRDNMFHFKIGEETHGLKPMNCPEGHLIYASRIRSYKDLPVRLAEPTGKLHRKEVSGSVGGLFRLYQFTQDDAHIYCRADQIEQEIDALLNLALKAHKIFGFESSFRLATKPDNSIGSAEMWEEAEKSLEIALKNSGVKYEVREKDGTFYGPKIDIDVRDSLDREWTIATIQIDFQLPERFNLEYVDKDGSKKRPVIIHRAMLGSFERFIGILLEHTEGKLPTWISPVQAVVVPVSEGQKEYGEKVLAELKKSGIRAELNSSNETLPKRIREAQLQKVPYILVVGDKEKGANEVAVRKRGSSDVFNQKVSEFIESISEEILNKKLN